MRVLAVGVLVLALVGCADEEAEFGPSRTDEEVAAEVHVLVEAWNENLTTDERYAVCDAVEERGLDWIVDWLNEEEMLVTPRVAETFFATVCDGA